jgi:hypothetical protein
MPNLSCLEKMVSAFEKTGTLKDLNTQFENVCAQFEIDQFAIISLRKDTSFLYVPVEESEVFDTYPRQWKQHYLHSRYYVYDPLHQALGFKGPFGWNEKSFRFETPLQKKIFREAYDYGIRKGTTIPTLAWRGEQTFVTVLNFEFLHPDVTQILIGAAYTYRYHKKKLAFNKVIESLTSREKEVFCLKLQN